jgi:hypothetical protein
VGSVGDAAPARVDRKAPPRATARLGEARRALTVALPGILRRHARPPRRCCPGGERREEQQRGWEHWRRCGRCSFGWKQLKKCRHLITSHTQLHKRYAPRIRHTTSSYACPYEHTPEASIDLAPPRTPCVAYPVALLGLVHLYNCEGRSEAWGRRAQVRERARGVRHLLVIVVLLQTAVACIPPPPPPPPHPPPFAPASSSTHPTRRTHITEPSS